MKPIHKAVLSCLAAFVILSTVARLSSCKTPPPNPYRVMAGQTAAWIAASAVKGPDGTSWPAIPSEPQPAALDLYSGVPGVVLFYLQAYASTGAPTYLDQARGGADFLLAKMAGVQGAGLYEGLSGIAFTLEETFKATQDDKYRKGFLDALDRIRAGAKASGNGIEWRPTTDIISGAAGTGLFLLYAYHKTGDRTWLELAAKAGSRLVDLGRPESGGLKWAMDPSFPRLMPNFSHGTAGIAYFLAALYREMKRPEFLEAALAGAKYLLAVANTESDSCLIFHDEPDNTGLYYLGWCHGPVGTARLFYLLSEVTGDDSWLDWVRRSANGLLKSGLPEEETPGFWNNAGICCGLAGVGEFFLDLNRALGDPAYLAFSKRVALRLLAKSTIVDLKMFWVQAEHRTRPDYLFAQTGYMQGAAGIGTFLFRLADAARPKPERIVFPDTPFTR